MFSYSANSLIFFSFALNAVVEIKTTELGFSLSAINSDMNLHKCLSKICSFGLNTIYLQTAN